MTITAGVLSQLAVTSTTDSLLATAATGGTGPYTYQWYRSTTTGFTPGGGNIISGATALTLNDTGLIPNTIYFYVVVATDTGHSNDTAQYTQLTVTTSAATLSQNQFQLVPYIGTVDQFYSTNTKAVQIDVSQATLLYAGGAVKMVNSQYGVPKVIGCTAATDAVFGFINFNFKDVSYAATSMAEVSCAGNVIYLYATGAIARQGQVSLDLSTVGGVRAISGHTGDNIVGWAYDEATAAGQLIRVQLTTPSFTAAP